MSYMQSDTKQKSLATLSVEPDTVELSAAATSTDGSGNLIISAWSILYTGF